MIAHRVLLYGFPIYLVGLEMLLRSLFGTDFKAFIGPALATSGLSFLLPVTALRSSEPEELPDWLPEIQEFKSRFGSILIVSKKDHEFVIWAWLAVLLCTALWICACAVAHESPKYEVVPYLPGHLAIGMLNYSIGLVFSLMKERI